MMTDRKPHFFAICFRTGRSGLPDLHYEKVLTVSIAHIQKMKEQNEAK